LYTTHYYACYVIAFDLISMWRAFQSQFNKQIDVQSKNVISSTSLNILDETPETCNYINGELYLFQL